MSVLGTIMLTRGIGLSSTSLVSKSVRTIVSFSSANIKQSLGLASGTSNPTLTLINGCNAQFTRHTSESASLAKAMQDAAKPLVICGPSGCGKSTIVNKISEEYPDCFGLCCSHTTRKPRESEVDGQNYYFVAKDEFLDARERGEFIETAEFAGNYYGTSRGAIKRVQMAGHICVLDIEMHGVHQIKKTSGLNPHYVFIKPPNLEELEVRLRDRKTETEDSIKKRLARAEEEMEYGSKAENFDLVITNDTLDNAVSQLRDFMIVHIEELKRFRKLLSERK
jgi:guanylate kinase